MILESNSTKAIQTRLAAPLQPRAVPRQKRHLAFSAPSPPPATNEEDVTRFRWNPAQSRWERVKAARDKDGKYKLGNWEEGGVSTIQTRTGGSYTVWPVIHSFLTDIKLQSVTPEEAHRLQQEEGAVLLDPRVPWDFDKERAEGAVSVPLYRGVAGKTAWDTIKRAVMAVGFAMRATERDPAFQQTAKETLPKDKKIIVYCGLGGTIVVGAPPFKPGSKSFKDDPERMFGRESRSLKACYELFQVSTLSGAVPSNSIFKNVKIHTLCKRIAIATRQLTYSEHLIAGYTNVLHLKGGLSQWRHDGFPVE